MPVKHVILCEGKHDIIFLSSLLSRNNVRHDSKTWEQICELSSRAGESQAISQFKKDKNVACLIKSEGNRDNCIDQMLELIKYDHALKAVLDSDNGATYRRIYKVKGNVGLEKASPNICRLRTGGNKVYPIFLYPDTLTNSVKMTTGRDLDRIRKKSDLEAAIDEFLNLGIEWVDDLIDFLVETESIG